MATQALSRPGNEGGGTRSRGWLSPGPIARGLYCLLLLLIGGALAIGGGVLLSVGGSAYYLAAGLATAIAGVLLALGRRAGVALFLAMLWGTLVWALWECGFDGWALAPRIVAPFVLALGLLLFPARPIAARGSRIMTGVVAMIAALLVGAGAHALRTDPADPILRNGIASAPAGGASRASGMVPAQDWTSYAGDAGSARFSALTQIDPGNVTGLTVAWRTRVGDTPPALGPSTALEVTPLKIGDTLYLCTGYNDVIALDAESGRQKWRFRAGIDIRDVPMANCRGVAFVRVASADCPERIITNTVGADLIALDARTGRLCRSFGTNGRVSLRTGMGEVRPGYYYVSSAPTIVRGRIVLGGWVFDNQYWGEPSGVIRAFDATTGALAWAWDMGRPDRKGAPPPGEHYTPATPNSWAPMSADETLGLVYVPTGGATPDHFGAQRRPFDEKYGSSIVAIDAETGNVRWSFQTVHHDLWDYDVPSAPALVDIPGPGGVRHALIQPTKRAEIFVLDRRTGRPLADVREVPVPRRGAVPEERLAATQPFSVGMPGFSGPPLSEQAMWGLTPLDQLWCRIRFRTARYDGPFTPPGVTPSLTYPGYVGGSNWGGVSLDLDRSIMIVTTLRLPTWFRLIPRKTADAGGVRPVLWSQMGGKTGGHATMVAQAGLPYAAQLLPFLSPIGVPCLQPPYGMIAAVDLKTRKLLWNKPFGSARESGPFGIRSGLPLTLGAPQHGGAITTAAGLTFVGASQDGRFRAFETATGRLLWETPLPAGGNATPMTYVSPRSGRQFVVIAAGGSRALQSRLGDYIVAYALPPRH